MLLALNKMQYLACLIAIIHVVIDSVMGDYKNIAVKGSNTGASVSSVSFAALRKPLSGQAATPALLLLAELSNDASVASLSSTSSLSSLSSTLSSSSSVSDELEAVPSSSDEEHEELGGINGWDLKNILSKKWRKNRDF
jgi:hypothetical protein